MYGVPLRSLQRYHGLLIRLLSRLGDREKTAPDVARPTSIPSCLIFSSCMDIHDPIEFCYSSFYQPSSSISIDDSSGHELFWAPVRYASLCTCCCCCCVSLYGVACEIAFFSFPRWTRLVESAQLRLWWKYCACVLSVCFRTPRLSLGHPCSFKSAYDLKNMRMQTAPLFYVPRGRRGTPLVSSTTWPRLNIPEPGTEPRSAAWGAGMLTITPLSPLHMLCPCGRGWSPV